MRGDHPLRSIRQFVEAALEALSPEFSKLYSARMGRPSTINGRYKAQVIAPRWIVRESAIAPLSAIMWRSRSES